MKLSITLGLLVIMLVLSSKTINFYIDSKLLEDVRIKIRSSYQTSNYSELYDALFLDIRSGFAKKWNAMFRDLGLLHVIAISGLHLMILFGAIYKFLSIVFSLLIRYLPRKFNYRLVIDSMSIGVVIIYIVLLKFPIPASRALLWIVLIFLFKLYGVDIDKLTLLAIVAFLTLILDWHYIFNVSWQLSFMAMFAIVICMKNKFDWLLTALLVNAYLIPIVVYHFGGYSLMGIIVNIVLSPLWFLVIVLGYAFIMLNLLFNVPSMFYILDALMGFLLKIMYTFEGSGLVNVVKIDFNWFFTCFYYLVLLSFTATPLFLKKRTIHTVEDKD